MKEKRSTKKRKKKREKRDEEKEAISSSLSKSKSVGSGAKKRKSAKKKSHAEKVRSPKRKKKTKKKKMEFGKEDEKKSEESAVSVRLPEIPSKLPWYLMSDGPSKRKKDHALYLKDKYVRKKDAKYQRMYQEAERIESEMIDDWAEQFGAIDCEDSELNWMGMDITVCMEKLMTLDEEWEQRMLIVQLLVHQLVEDDDNSLYCLKLCKFLAAIGRQFDDPRSLVIEALRDHLSRLAYCSPARFVFFAPYFYQKAIVIFGIRIEVMREAVVALGEAMVRACLSADAESNDYALLDCIIEHLDYRSAAGRMESARFLCIYLHHFQSKMFAFDALSYDEIAELGKKDKEKVEFMEYIDEAVRKAVNGSAAEIRTQGYFCLARWIQLAPVHAQAIIDTMSRAVKRKYDRITAKPKTP